RLCRVRSTLRGARSAARSRGANDAARCGRRHRSGRVAERRAANSHDRRRRANDRQRRSQRAIECGRAGLMLRWLVALLLLANVAFYVWSQGWLDDVVGVRARGDREPERLTRQFHPEVIKILTPQAVAAAASAA